MTCKQEGRCGPLARSSRRREGEERAGHASEGRHFPGAEHVDHFEAAGAANRGGACLSFVSLRTLDTLKESASLDVRSVCVSVRVPARPPYMAHG